MSGGAQDGQHVVIVGASLAGTRTAQALRLRGFTGRITLVGAEAELPYDRPPLSKQHLAADHDPSPTLLLSESALAELRIQLRLETRATRLDLTAGLVHVDQGAPIGYDHLVIATGARPRPLPIEHDLQGFHVLRTLGDAYRLREALDRHPNVAIIGGGFIGAEVAAASRERGLDVTIVETLAAPMARVLGDQVGGLLAILHRDHGVELRCGHVVHAVHGIDGWIRELELDDGTLVAAQLVVVGLGAVPETRWLEGSGLDIHDGVRCDSSLRAAGHPNVYAAGDVARWWHPTLGQSLRVEHWTSAQEHAGIVAAGIVGIEETASAIPYVWSDQYKRRIQIIGRPANETSVTVIEDPVDGRHVAAYADRQDDRLRAVLTIDAPRVLMQGRRAIANGETAGEFLSRL